MYEMGSRVDAFSARHLETLIRDATGLSLSDLPPTIDEPLDSLAQTAHLLGMDGVSLSTFESSLAHISAESSRMQQHIHLLDHTEEELKCSIEEARYRDSLVKS